MRRESTVGTVVRDFLFELKWVTQIVQFRVFDVFVVVPERLFVGAIAV